MYREAILITREGRAHNGLRLAVYLNNLAELLYRSRGDYEEAEVLYKEVSVIIRKSLPHHHPHLAVHLNSLAIFYECQGNCDAAESSYLESLQISIQTLSEDHPNLKIIWDNVLNFYQTSMNENFSHAQLPEHPLRKIIQEKLKITPILRQKPQSMFGLI